MRPEREWPTLCPYVRFQLAARLIRAPIQRKGSMDRRIIDVNERPLPTAMRRAPATQPCSGFMDAVGDVTQSASKASTRTVEKPVDKHGVTASSHNVHRTVQRFAPRQGAPANSSIFCGTRWIEGKRPATCLGLLESWPARERTILRGACFVSKTRSIGSGHRFGGVA